MILELKDFDYELPKELVASYPIPKRSEARLLVLDRKTGEMRHRIFKDIVEYFQKGDLLVLNNTKVLPARLFGRRPTGGKVEALLLKPIPSPQPSPLRGEGRVREDWEILVRPSGRIKKGTRLEFGENGIRLEGEVMDEPSKETGIRRIRFDAEGFRKKLAKIGRIPLPPYLDRPDEEIDRELYQTVFAEVEGAVASPTAGLHFDKELLNRLQGKGIETCFVTLHVSYGTFQPVQTGDLSKHEIYEEEFEISARAAEQIRQALKAKRRIIACGTTVVRVLETAGKNIISASPRAVGSGRLDRAAIRRLSKPPFPLPLEGERVLGEGVGTVQSLKDKTRLFIYPPFEFQIVDAMITNFHIPRSTLLMLVSAFAGRDLIFKAYEEAIRERYRFYSYGDAMLIL